MEIRLVVLQVTNTADAPVTVHVDARDVGSCDHLQAARLLGLRDRRDRGRALGANVAAAATAEAVVDAGRSVAVGPRVDRRRPRERMPPEPSRRPGHELGEPGAPQRRHGVVATARPLENVAARVDLAADVPRLTRHTDRLFHPVVVRLELLEAERPILHGGARGNSPGAVPARRLADDLEVPRVEAPALRPVVQRGAADRVHHRVDGRPG